LITIGLTGGMLRKCCFADASARGAKVVDVDWSRMRRTPGTAGRPVARRVREQVVDAEGEIDRQVLEDSSFRPDQMKKLTDVVGR
jgi:hypothetical protein